MNTSDVLARFERDGYIVIEDFCDSELMDGLDQLIRSHFGENPDFLHSDEFLDKAKTDVIPWFPQNEGVDTFDVIDADSRLGELSDAILGDNWTSQYCMVMFSKKGTSGQAWHQDCAPDDPKVFNLNRLVYTSDITDEIGGQTVVVPGSHRRGLIPAGDPVGEFDGQVVLRPKQGTLVLLHGHTWHRVLPIKGAYRFSTNYRAAPVGTPDNITDVCVYRNMRYQFSTSRVIEERFATRTL
ncbi:MAG: phytanoyl-CoA dioxygenase family protein [Gammaproteobacteria bacterium]|nr:phytanoyl-CoA dioxygenase family protein [Gammaproteobacteria bacterium]MDH3372943.1 phytanoyl-CoA dioxygenase family protein [Gammaproteobacteria bacterium]